MCGWVLLYHTSPQSPVPFPPPTPLGWGVGRKLTSRAAIFLFPCGHFFLDFKVPGDDWWFSGEKWFLGEQKGPRGVAKKCVPSSSFPIHAPSLCGSLRTDALGNVRRATEYNRRGHPQALPGPAARTSLNQGEGRVPCPAVTAIWGGGSKVWPC